MPRPHPLRPLVLALSLRLNDPDRLLAELRAPGAAGGGNEVLASAARQAAFELARAAVAFNGTADVAGYAASEAFRRAMMDAAVPLMCVGTMPWPDEMDGSGFEDERRFRRACLDFGTGCFALTSRVPRPDRANLLTNVLKAIPLGYSHGDWTFSTLPDYGADVPDDPVPAGP